VLDFGCGPGRVLQSIHHRRPGWRVTGTDIDDVAIAWARQAIPNVRFVVNDVEPPMPVDDGAFDICYAISVFTHLDEAMQDQWLGDVARILRPGGWAFLSVRGAPEAARLPRSDRERLERAGHLFIRKRTLGIKLDGLPVFYQTAFHTVPYVADHWSRWLTIVEHVPLGMNGDHDLVVAQRSLVA
jgi:SAM-dependent methyltransferase